MIGNSLTWNTQPTQLDGTVSWDIFCGKNLQYIYDNPNDHCVNTSTPWTTSLPNESFDWLVMQPYDGTTLEQDASIITTWMNMQPSSKVLLHTGWAGHADFESVYNFGNPDDNMRQNPAYFNDLIDELESRNPGRYIKSTNAFEYLNSIATDINLGIGPFNEIADLYRDDIHMNDTGSYLMHNVIRKSLGQQFPNGGSSLDPDIKQYLDGKLLSVPEPSHWILLWMGLGLFSIRRKRSRFNILHD